MLLLGAALISLLICIYYVSQGQNGPNSTSGVNGPAAALLGPDSSGYDQRLATAPDYSEPSDGQVSTDTCPNVVPRDTDIDAHAEFAKLDFQLLITKYEIHEAVLFNNESEIESSLCIHQISPS
ncbi:hypothetical protein QAD02_019814 [Eretmocerus hayati]|uniref:Uncharacterized protein n=1 Tax=Eretmocerus hayati TaxID=131215 RepID=A0ACC2PKX4_9HYME|nr:hypothetical protein QAD02_019814 [Eretmocerus hayati]